MQYFTLRNIIRLVIVSAVVALAQIGTVQAGSVGFGSDTTSWTVNISYCVNGFTVTASGGATDKDITSSVVVLSSSIPTTGLPGLVATGVGTGVGQPVIKGSATFFFVNYQKPGTPITVTVARLDNGGNISGSPKTDTDTTGTCTAGSSKDPRLFDPGDSRVSALPGDRIAFYCNAGTSGPMANTIDMWSISPTGNGQRLTTFKYKDVVAAGAKGLSRDLGVNGTVFIIVDPSGKYFYSGWLGGPYQATGLGDFAKSFVCSFA